MTRFARTLALLVVVAGKALGGAASAADIHVSGDGVDSAVCGAFDAPCATLAAGHAAATDGDVIQIAQGRFETADFLIDKDVVLQGAGAAQTVLTGNQSGRVLRIAGGATVTVQDVSITEGRVVASKGGVAQGGGIFNAGQLILRRVIVSDNHVLGFNGDAGRSAGDGTDRKGTAASGSKEKCKLKAVKEGKCDATGTYGRDGAAGSPGGAGSHGTPGGHAYGGGVFSTGWLLVDDSTLINNSASAGAGGNGGNGGDGGDGQTGGAGSYLRVGLVCEASQGGRGGAGGAAGDGGDGGASGDAFGGGIYSAIGAPLYVVNSKVMRNHVIADKQGIGGTAGKGGSAGTHGAKGKRPAVCPDLSSYSFPAVSAARNGAGAYDGQSGMRGRAIGGGLYFGGETVAERPQVEGSLIVDNSANIGGGLFANGAGPFTILHVSFVANQARYIGPAAGVIGHLSLLNSLSVDSATEFKLPEAIPPAAPGNDPTTLHQAEGAPFAIGPKGATLRGNCIEGSPADTTGSLPDCHVNFVAGAGEDGIIGTADDDYRIALDDGALDTADPAFARARDMNGAERNFDFAGVGEAGVAAPDPGAFETAPQFMTVGQAVTPPVDALDAEGLPFQAPDIVPAQMADNLFWHAPSRRLFLINDLASETATLSWRTTPVPSVAELAEMTAEDIAAEVKVEQWIGAVWPNDAPLHMTNTPLDVRPADDTGLAFVGLAQLTSEGSLSGSVFRTGAAGTHSVLRFIPADVDANTDPEPQFLVIKSIAATPMHTDYRCVVGAELGHNTHEDPTRRAFIPASDAPYDPIAYDTTTRTGQIVPVGTQPFTAAWYRHGPLGLYYASEVVEHRCNWPSDARELLLSDHSRAITPGLPPEAEVYRQIDGALAGHRLNNAHAFVAPVQDGLRLAALRYPADATDRQIIVRGRDEVGFRHAVYRMVAEKDDAPLDKVGAYVVGQEIRPPTAITLAGGRRCSSTSYDGPVYVARSGALWVQADAGPSDPIRLHWRYQNRRDFDGGPDADAEGCLPWLSTLSPDGDAPYPLTALANWPKDAPKIPVGKTELGDLNGQSSAKMLHGGDLGIRLFDPYAERSVALKALPPSIEKDDNGFFTAVPRNLLRRVWFADGRLRVRGRRDTEYGDDQHPLLYLNILSDAEAAALKSLDSNVQFAEAVEGLLAETRKVDHINRTEIIAGAKALSTGAATGTGHISVAFNDAEGAGGPFSIKIYNVTCPAYAAPVHAIAPPGLFDETMQLRYGADFGGEAERVRVEWLYRTTRPPVDYGPRSDWNSLPGSAEFDEGGETETGRGVLSQHIGAPSDLSLQDLWVLARARGFEDVCAPEGGTPAAPVISGETLETPTSFARPAFAEGWLKRVLGRLNAFESRQQNILLEGVKLDTSLLALAGQRYESDVPLSATPEALGTVGLIEAYETVLRRARKLSIDRPDGGYDPDAAPGGGDPLLMASARIAGMYEDMAAEAIADFSDPTLPVLSQMEEQIARSTSRRAFEGQADTALDEELALLRGLSPATMAAPVYNRLEWNTVRGDSVTGLYAGTYGLSFETDTGNTSGAQALRVAAARAYPQGHGDAWGHFLSAQKSFYRLLRAPRFRWPYGRSTVAVAGGGSTDVEYAEERQFAAISAAKAEAGVNIAKATYRRNWTPNAAARLSGFPDKARVILRDPKTGKRRSVARVWGGDDWARRAGHGAYLDWVAGNALLPANPCGQPNQSADCDAPSETLHRGGAPELIDLADAHGRIQGEMDQIATGLNPLGLTVDDVPFGIDPNRVAFERAGHFGQVADLAFRELETARAAFDRVDVSNKAALKAAEREQTLRSQVATQEADLRERLIRIYGRPYPEDVGPGRTYPGGTDPEDRYIGPDIYHYDMIDTDIAALFGDGFDNAAMFEVAFDVHRDVAVLLDTRDEILTSQDGGNENARFLTKAPDFLLAPLDFVMEKLGTSSEISDKNLLTPNPEALDAVRDASGLQTVTMTFAPDLGGALKPAEFVSPRPAYGEIQVARTALVRELAALRSATTDYENDLEMLALHISKLEKLVEGQEYEQQILKQSREKILVLQAATLGLTTTTRGFDLAERMAKEKEEITITSLPAVVGTSNDPLAPARAGVMTTGSVTRSTMSLVSMGFETARDAVGIMREQIELDTNFQLLAGVARNKERLDETQWILESAQREPILRLGVLQQFQTVREAEMRYRSALDEGRRLLIDLARLRRETTATVLTARYRDALNRALRTEALETYNEQVDAAARQVFRAALAYDYETIRSGYTKGEFDRFLQAILHERSIGDVEGDRTARGRTNGLAGLLAELKFKYETAFKPTSGFLQARNRSIILSLRNGLFEVGRIREVDEANGNRVLVGIERAKSADADWQRALSSARRVDLRDIPEFMSCCLTGHADRNEPSPGFAFTFETKIGARLNLFGNRLGNDYQAPANAAAHRIAGVAVVLKGYDAHSLRMSPTPQAFLIPVGRDVTRGKRGEGRRTWRVRDVFANDPARQREMIGMSAYAGEAAFLAEKEPYSAGLIGRSLENTKWMLIIPAHSFKADGEAALNKLLGKGNSRAEIEDIELRLQIYSYNEG